MPRVLAPLGLLLSLAFPSAGQIGSDATLTDVAYGGYADPEQPESAELLDLYVHSDAETPQPVLIEVHGGAFMEGTKGDFAWYLADEEGIDVIDKAFDAGFAVVTLDYPLAAPALLPTGQPNPKFPENKYPRAAHSVRRAIQFVRSKAVEWNLDPERVFLIGNSSGGNLCLWSAMTRDIAKPTSSNPVAQQSSRPNGVVFLSTPTFLDPAHLLLPPDQPEIANYFGKTSQAALDKPSATKKALAASPAWRVCHKKGLAKTSADMVELNVSTPLLGVYSNLDVSATSSSYAFPVDDPHSAAFGLLMREAFDEYAQQMQDPHAHWTDFSLLGVKASDPEEAASAADAVAAWLQQRAEIETAVPSGTASDTEPPP